MNMLTHSIWNMFYLRKHNHFYRQTQLIYEKMHVFVTCTYLLYLYNGGMVPILRRIVFLRIRKWW